MSKLDVKHLTKPCLYTGCDAQAFVQVVIVEDAKKQAKIDEIAYKKLAKFLEQDHKEGHRG